jgi:hypothetical protein
MHDGAVHEPLVQTEGGEQSPSFRHATQWPPTQTFGEQSGSAVQGATQRASTHTVPVAHCESWSHMPQTPFTHPRGSVQSSPELQVHTPTMQVWPLGQSPSLEHPTQCPPEQCPLEPQSASPAQGGLQWPLLPHTSPDEQSPSDVHAGVQKPPSHTPVVQSPSPTHDCAQTPASQRPPVPQSESLPQGDWHVPASQISPAGHSLLSVQLTNCAGSEQPSTSTSATRQGGTRARGRHGSRSI